MRSTRRGSLGRLGRASRQPYLTDEGYGVAVRGVWNVVGVMGNPGNEDLHTGYGGIFRCLM